MEDQAVFRYCPHFFSGAERIGILGVSGVLGLRVLGF